MTDPIFGDRQYAEADFTPHFTHHPSAPVQFGIGNLLREAYLHAQQHSRVVIQQCFGYDTKNFAGDLSSARAFVASSASAWVGITRGWIDLPRGVNFLVAEIDFVLFNFAPAQVEHRLTCYNGSTCDSATSTEEFTEDDRSSMMISNGQLVISQGDLARYFNAEFPFANVFALRRSTVRLPLENLDITAPGSCDVRLEAHANRTADGTSYAVPVQYRPLFVQISTLMEWEVSP